MKQIELIPVDKIDPPPTAARIRPDDESLSELMASIKVQGILNPLILNKKGDRYYCIAGARRYLAAIKLNLPSVPAAVIQVSDDEAAVLSLHENLFRKNLSPYEESLLLDDLEHKYHLTRERISAMLGVSKAWVTQRLDILSWPEMLLEALKNESITYSVARELSRITEPGSLASYLESAINNGITSRVAAQWAGEWQASQHKVEQVVKVKSQPLLAGLPDKCECYACQKNLDPAEDDLTTVILCKECADALRPPNQT